MNRNMNSCPQDEEWRYLKVNCNYSRGHQEKGTLGQSICCYLSDGETFPLSQVKSWQIASTESADQRSSSGPFWSSTRRGKLPSAVLSWRFNIKVAGNTCSGYGDLKEDWGSTTQSYRIHWLQSEPHNMSDGQWVSLDTHKQNWFLISQKWWNKVPVLRRGLEASANQM